MICNTNHFKKIFIILVLISGVLMSQNETNNWYFGNKSGLNFNNANLNILTDSNMNTIAGCSSISNRNGELLFYTNGESVWNKNHVLMDNGSNLAGDINNSQTSIIIPKPNDDNVYYIFTTREQSSNSPLLTSGLFYSEVEFSNQFPLGKVKIKNIRLTQSITERITAIHHAQSNSIRVITFGSQSAQSGTPRDTFYIFNVTENGVNRIPIIDKKNANLSSSGAMKISPNGENIAIADSEGRYIYLYFFDNETQTITFDKTLLTDLFFVPIEPYGVEFSQDSRTLFYSGASSSTSYLIQYGLKMPESDEGKIIVATSSQYEFGSLQIASNGKIYIANYKQNNPIMELDHISVINSPENNANVEFQALSISLQTGLSFKGLPNFVQSFFMNRIITENKCVSEILDFSLEAYAPLESVLWEFGDGSTSTLLETNHQYSIPGKYIVKATISINNKPITLCKEIVVYPLPKLKADQTLIQCDTDNDGFAYFNLYNIEEKMDNPANINYVFSFYTAYDDAINNTNEIQNPDLYQNSSNPQELFVKITSPETCSNISNFFIETTYTSLDNIEVMFSCEISDNIHNNNEGVFNLKAKEAEIRNQFNIPSATNINFYKTFQEAETKTNTLSAYYTSSSATIWVRIDNKDFGCYGIEPINLIVNESLELNVEDYYTTCDSSIQSSIIIDGGIKNDRWEWKNNSQNIISINREFEIKQSGTFYLTVYKTENQIQCSTTKKFIVKESGIPIFNKITADNYQIFVTINGESNYEYSLDNIMFSGQGLNHRFFNVSAGVYTVYVRDKNNCEPTISTKVSLIGFPKYFTPNNDGINDVWKIEGVTDDLYIYADISIFDRYGKSLYNMDLTKNQDGWDGTYNGRILTTTDYWFKATLTDKKNSTFTRIGHFSLKQ